MGGRCIWIGYLEYMNIIKYFSGKRKLCRTIVRIAWACIPAEKRVMFVGDGASMFLWEGGFSVAFFVGNEAIRCFFG
jgi:hypothetical protein